MNVRKTKLTKSTINGIGGYFFGNFGDKTNVVIHVGDVQSLVVFAVIAKCFRELVCPLISGFIDSYRPHNATTRRLV